MTPPIYSLDVLAVWFTTTQRLLLTARNERDSAALRRAALRVDSPIFKELPTDAQEGLIELYGQAMVACGALSP